MKSYSSLPPAAKTAVGWLFLTLVGAAFLSGMVLLFLFGLLAWLGMAFGSAALFFTKATNRALLECKRLFGVNYYRGVQAKTGEKANP